MVGGLKRFDWCPAILMESAEPCFSSLPYGPACSKAPCEHVIQPVRIHLGHRGDQRFGIGVEGRSEDLRGPSTIIASQHDGGAVGDAPHRAEIMGDEEIGDAQIVLEAASAASGSPPRPADRAPR